MILTKFRLEIVFLKVTVKLIKICQKHGVPWTLENPKTSRVWLTPHLLQFLNKDAALAEVHYCQYKTPWRKATFCLHKGFPKLSCLKTCENAGGLCSATGKRHLILSGRDTSGTFLTHRAEPYPKPMCEHIADIVFEQLNKLHSHKDTELDVVISSGPATEYTISTTASAS